jgi:hypothetical protein
MFAAGARLQRLPVGDASASVPREPRAKVLRLASRDHRDVRLRSGHWPKRSSSEARAFSRSSL